MNTRIQTVAEDIETDQQAPLQPSIVQPLTEAELMMVGGGGSGVVDFG